MLEAFDYRGVRLDGGILRRQFDQTRDFYLHVPNDDLLKGFRERAGRPAPGVELGGWYSKDCGNIFGQFLSGLARMYAATGDPACKAKADALLHEWALCIGPDGYPFYSLHPASATYNYDKLVGGLVDMIAYCANPEAPAALARITDWAERNLNRIRDYANADGAGPRAPWSEWYTLSENLYRAYLATGDARYRDFAEVWEYTEYWNLYAGNKDIFAPRVNDATRASGECQSAYHAYSHVNTLSGAAMAYAVKGEKRYLDVLTNAYEYLRQHQWFATGGYGPNELLAPRAEMLRLLAETHNTVETQCCSWAAFKLSRYLILFTGDARYGDWAERILYNCIGASLPNAADGRVFYYADYNPAGARKVLYDSGWSCCSGSRPMAVAAYHDLIYFRDAENLYVNLYAPSTVEWKHADRTITVTQRTRFPEEETVEFTVSIEKPAQFGLNLRAPGWLAGGMSATINGKPVEARVGVGHWVCFHRQWRAGDTLIVTLPMRFRAESLDAARGYPTAICYGPVVMAVRSLDGNPADRIDLKNLAKALVPSPGEPLTYRLRTDPNILLRPFYALKENEPYYLYLDPAAPAS
ncbi:MAG: glycoside hydrolase family 127 protein [Verrucomicrobia bacterium]|nr:glycoside hydrolase family 127 protein [Verrucomicrobiota bacterium]